MHHPLGEPELGQRRHLGQRQQRPVLRLSTAASSATVQSPTTLTVMAGQTDFADATTVQATLTTTVSPKPIANEQVTFTLSDDTVPCPAAMTNASGVASRSITPSEKRGPTR